MYEKNRDVSFVESEGLFDFEEVVEALQRVFGIVGICPVLKVNDEGFDQLSGSDRLYGTRISGWRAYVQSQCKKSKKNYPKNSMELNADLGERILEAFPNMSVDVHHPEITLNVEIREKIYLFKDHSTWWYAGRNKRKSYASVIRWN